MFLFLKKTKKNIVTFPAFCCPSGLFHRFLGGGGGGGGVEVIVAALYRRTQGWTAPSQAVYREAVFSPNY